MRALSHKRFGLLSCVFLVGISASSIRAQSIIPKGFYETERTEQSISFLFRLREAAASGILWRPQGGSDWSEKVLPEVSTDHSVKLTNLTPAANYEIELYTIGIAPDTVRFVSSTYDKLERSGMVTAYFNRSADTTLSPPLSKARQNSDYLSLLLKQIASARSSIDLAFYSFSGQTASSLIAPLRDATNNMLTVRVILDSASSWNSTAYKGLRAAGVPVILNSFGSNADVSKNIHHNKFAIIDGFTTLTGSWNLSDRQTRYDYQDVIVIGSTPIAKIYQTEFNEEWGTAERFAKADSARFSKHKTDNTPRVVSYSGHKANIFFSPNGGAAAGLEQLIRETNANIFFSVFSFTRADISTAIIDQAAKGVAVHGLIGAFDQFEETAVLRAAGLDVIAYAGPDTNLLHHKYAILDAGTPEAVVVTGSYNWSTAAENTNNENMIALHDRKLAEEYFEEFLARYSDSGGKERFTIRSAVAATKIHSRKLDLISLGGERFLRLGEQFTMDCGVFVVDLAGREVYRSVLPAGYSLLALPKLPLGPYIVRYAAGGEQAVAKIMIAQ